MAPRTRMYRTWRKQEEEEGPRSSGDILAGGPPSSRGGESTSGERGPLGVPDNYRVDVPAMGGPTDINGNPLYGRERETYGVGNENTRSQGPRYMEGDEWRPGGWGPERIADLQRMLTIAGLLNPKESITLGALDATTRNAYRALLEQANALGMDWQTAVAHLAQTTAAGGGPGHIDPATGEWVPDQSAGFVAPPLELRLPNRDDVVAVLRQGVIDQLGEGWTQEQLGELADAYIAQVRGVQTDAYNQQVAIERGEFEGTRGAGGEVITTTEAPSPETFLESELQRRDPEGLQAGQLINETLPAFFDMMRGWS